jgi:superfamily I DNA and/or RNA helicase
MGGRSKSNTGQVKLIQRVLPLLKEELPETSSEKSAEKSAEKSVETAAGTSAQKPAEKSAAGKEDPLNLNITILSPYTKQIKELKTAISNIPIFTIDSFQGREADIIIFSSVRCNEDNDIGFLEDVRRLNVMWTRARLALIIVGDRRTMNASDVWKRALLTCSEVKIDLT